MVIVPTGIGAVVGEAEATKSAPSHTITILCVDYTSISIRARTLVVVIGAMSESVRLSTSAPPTRSSNDAGSRSTATDAAKSAFASVQKADNAKTVCHQTSHRRTVRTGTPFTSLTRPRPTSFVSRPIPLAITTTAAKYSLRPRNRSDGGVARLRQPSTRQHRLSLRVYPSAAPPSSPRGLRG